MSSSANGKKPPSLSDFIIKVDKMKGDVGRSSLWFGTCWGLKTSLLRIKINLFFCQKEREQSSSPLDKLIVLLVKLDFEVTSQIYGQLCGLTLT